MANKPIRMSKLRHVLKLHCQRHSKLNISTVTGFSRNRVKKYLNVFIGFHTILDEINGLSDKVLDEFFCKEPEVVVDKRLKELHVFFTANEKQLKRRGVTFTISNTFGQEATRSRNYNKSRIELELEGASGLYFVRIAMG